MRQTFAKLFQLVTGQAPPAAPTTRAGIRQAAAAQYAARKAGAPPQTPQELFLAGLYKLTIGVDFQSTNPSKPAVYQVWYDPAIEHMYVTFFDHPKGGGYRVGPTYHYWTITLPEAEKMYRDASKGISVWDDYRVRGSRWAHKKNYARV